MDFKGATASQIISHYKGMITPTNKKIAADYGVGRATVQKRLAAGIENGEIVRHIEGSLIWYTVAKTGAATLPRSSKGVNKLGLDGVRGERESYLCKQDNVVVSYAAMDIEPGDGGVWPANYPAFRAGYLGNGID